MTSRQLHRILSILVVAVTLYLGVTGSLIETIDFKTIITHPGPFDSDLRYVELRMAGGRAVGQVRDGEHEWRFDPVTGQALGVAPAVLDEGAPPVSWRNTFKHLHRMTTFGDWALWINVVVAIALITLIVTGDIIYWQVWKVRRRTKKPNLF